jgi:hypothetical protein
MHLCKDLATHNIIMFAVSIYYPLKQGLQPENDCTFWDTSSCLTRIHTYQTTIKVIQTVILINIKPCSLLICCDMHPNTCLCHRLPAI